MNNNSTPTRNILTGCSSQQQIIKRNGDWWWNQQNLITMIVTAIHRGVKKGRLVRRRYQPCSSDHISGALGSDKDMKSNKRNMYRKKRIRTTRSKHSSYHDGDNDDDDEDLLPICVGYLNEETKSIMFRKTEEEEIIENLLRDLEALEKTTDSIEEQIQIIEEAM